MSLTFTAWPLYVKTELRAMTNNPETFGSPVMRSSVTRSPKYSCAGSRLRFAKGSTATEVLSGNASPGRAGVPS